ncbi:MAG: endonuclease/exonuclease/phosphatase family protein [Prevotella sp.]|jgi:endonuclease/exonuclease/phosphatase family metal-dependent hydrolase|nr:endonuclease/exonuclease/phosphatase family protein [Prevotella sp.]MCH3992653.1 endonuclease/exonuclease/phosphatase family protein [Prevotella sp.]MCH4099245.1 endonuclease/exonuclease/phosphatase family protein [Prevotella sp.]MCI1472958.1 endonuclease/exonuclease/phosphatase family protein [Prevotella sp.]MCI1518054.1 endonuclease/exonuclease/phosphatase family protein [Prevotella sp.]MCI1550025.1 endonuclease/exonuclease/phosphatase family protein [Prevotella sp.]
MRKGLMFLFLLFVAAAVNAQQLTVGTYNVRNHNHEDELQGNGWSQRCPVISELVTFNDFDIWGAQEVLHDQLNDLLSALPQYGYLGVGRDDGKTKGEYAPIFYKKSRFRALKDGHFWLSEHTGYPNKGWDAACIRICTWGYFKDLQTKRKLWFFNLHMDHIGVTARRESSKLVLKKIRSMCGNDPVILTGDFNVDQTHESYRLLANSGILQDSYKIADMSYALNGTFNGFDPYSWTNSQIDHVFVSKQFHVYRFGILTDTYRTPRNMAEEVHEKDAPKEISFQKYDIRMPSDHFPVKVILKYQK